MPDPNSPPTSPRSTATERHRRRLRRRIFGGVAIALVVALGALWFSDTIRIPTEGPKFAGGSELSGDEGEGPAPALGVDEPSRRALNLLQPLEVWVGGDSLAGALGPALGRMTGETGVVQPYYDSRISTGLMTGDFDWPEHAEQQLAVIQPEVVVFIIGTNDAIVYDPSQADEYALLTEQMMKTLVGPGREVYWVNAPVMADEDLEENIQEVDRIQRAVANKFPDRVTFVDAHTLFADEQGEYQSSLLGENGDRVSLRAGDGIHLSGAGGERLANAVFALLDARWRIREQAVPGNAKRVIVARGSDAIPGGGSRSSGSGSGSNSSGNGSSSNGQGSGSGTTSTTASTATTTPTTAPPATTPTTSSPPSTTPTSTPGG